MRRRLSLREARDVEEVLDIMREAGEVDVA